MNLGVIRGGVASNVVSPSASFDCLVRTVGNNDRVLETILALTGERSKIDVYYNVEPARMIAIPEFETTVAAYCTDIPNFAPLGATCVLFGPGSIFHAHTDHEHVTRDDLAGAISGYTRIYRYLAAA